jgi:Patatin-like phospholipase
VPSRARTLAPAIAGALLTAACASSHVLSVPRASGEMPCIAEAPARDLQVGVALSGGGSRAALFGAAGLEELGRIRTADGGSALERVTFLSSVSGGSLAAAHYAVHKPPRQVRVLAADGTLSAEYQDFFERSRTALSQDFERAMLRRQLASLRWLNSALAARSLSEILNARLLGEATVLDVSRRQGRGDSPGLIVNTTLYNNGRRMAGTSLPSEAFRYDFLAALRGSLERQGRPVGPWPALARRAELLLPLTPLDINMNPCPTRIAGWVAGSASFPPLVGPITLNIGGDSTYWHAGDGGLYENQGLESLLFLFLRQMQAGNVRRALIVAFDGSFPFSVGQRRLDRRALPFSLLTFDFSRIPSIMEERASAYQALFFRSLQLEGVIPDEETLRVIPLRHVDADWAPDLSDLPAACRGEKALDSPEAVRERISEIPTRLRRKSPCDRQLLTTAAAKVVRQRRAEIAAFLDGRASASATGGSEAPAATSRVTGP